MVDLMKLRLGDRFECGGMESKVTSLATMIGDTMLVNCWQYSRDGVSVTGSRRPITAIHPAAEPAADGWVKMKPEWLSAIGKAASAIRFECGQDDWHTHEAKAELLRIADALTEVETAYARHLEPKPVLVWDDDEHCSRSHSGDATYLVTSTRTENDKRWFAHLVDRIAQVSPLVGGFGYSKRDEAKQACERHARGE